MRLIQNTFLAPPRVPCAALLLALASFLLGLWASPVHAQNAQNRILPADSYQVTIDSISAPTMVVDNTTVQIAAGSLIFTADNRTITSGSLSAGTVVRIQFNGQCQVKKIWVLSQDEVVPEPWYMAFLPASFTPPCSS